MTKADLSAMEAAASGVGGWVAPFLASIFLILFGSGWVMARLATAPDVVAGRPDEARGAAATGR